MANVSVIIPVYKVECYVERCVRSIMNQTYTEEVECIIVNDCTPDRSMEIVERLVAQYDGNIQFKLLYHECNRGLAAVRNTGMKSAIGDYVIHIDSDDYVEPDMLEKMYKKAVVENADIVVADYWTTYENEEIYCSQFTPENKDEALKNILNDKLGGYNWNKLYLRSLYTQNQLTYMEGIDYGEDLLLSIQAFFYARKIAYIPMAFTHYVQYNSNSYSSQFSLRGLLCLIRIESFFIDFFKSKNVYQRYQKEIFVRQIIFQKTLLLFTTGRLQKRIKTSYKDITPLVALKYGSILGPYWHIAIFFVSLGMLPVFNLMRVLWKIVPPSQNKSMVYYNEGSLDLFDFMESK